MDAIVSLLPNDEIAYGGTTFSVLGLPRVFSDFARPVKVTVLLERHLS